MYSFVLIGCYANELHMPIYVPIVIYGLRLLLFYKITLFTKLFTSWFHQSYFFSITSLSFVTLNLLVSELANVLPEVIYLLFYTNYIVY